MLIATGTALALLTWALAVVLLVTAGLLPALATAPRRPVDASTIARRALWWGLLVLTVFAYLAAQLWALQDASTAVAGWLVLAVLGVPGWLLLVRRRSIRPQRPIRPGEPGWARLARVGLWLTLGGATAYLAAAVVGPVTNFDSGLYHLSAVQYAGAEPAIPGLANLFFAFGYGNAEFPLAALLGNGPWGVEGYRLLNGLLLAAVVVDAAIRMRQRRLTPGLPILLISVLAGWVPMVALSDYWVTSPSQDSAVMAITMVAAAYLADAVAGARGWLADAAVAAALSIVLVLFRPTMAAFALVVVVIALLLAHRRRRSRERLGWVVGIVGIAGLVAGFAAVWRDYVLSGWLQYPLSVHAFDVPWRAPDPTQYRDATLGYHRNPADLWGSVEGWAWVGPWLRRLPSQWETFEFAGLVIVAVGLALIAYRRLGPALRLRAMLVALAPSAFALVTWWTVSPPSFRFAWGPLFALPAVAIGWSLWRLSLARGVRVLRLQPAAWMPLATALIALPLLIVTAYTALFRFDAAAVTSERTWSLGIEIPYAVAPPFEPVVDETTLPSGLTVLVPRDGQCWMAFPLCTTGPEPDLRPLGSSLRDGFASGP